MEIHSDCFAGSTINSGRIVLPSSPRPGQMGRHIVANAPVAGMIFELILFTYEMPVSQAKE